MTGPGLRGAEGQNCATGWEVHLWPARVRFSQPQQE